MEVETEFEDYDISTHYQSDILGLDWTKENHMPKFKQWLIEQYGEDIKQYATFALLAT